MSVPYLLKGRLVQKFFDIVNNNDRLMLKYAEFYIEDSIVDFYAEEFKYDSKWICSLFNIEETSFIHSRTFHYSINDKPGHSVMSSFNIGQVVNLSDFIHEFLNNIEVLKKTFPHSIIVLKWRT